MGRLTGQVDEPSTHDMVAALHPPLPANIPARARRIAFFLPSLYVGGAERVLLDIASAFSKLGHEVHLVLMNAYASPLLSLVPPELEVVDLQCPRFWTSGPALLRYVRARRPEGIVAAMPLANAIAGYTRAVAGLPLQLVLTEHNARSLTFGDVDTPSDVVLAPVIRLGYRYADRIVAVSHGVAERLRRTVGIRRDRVRVVYNPAYSPKIESLALESSPHPWLEQSSIPVIIGSGRLEPQKDFETLLRAFAQLVARRPARLIILGEGAQRNRLQALAAQLGIGAEVALPGFVLNPWSYMSRAAVFALSSVHEGLGNVLVEALALGLPVVSTDCPFGPAEILGAGRFGTLVAPRDVAALAQAIDRAIDTPIARVALQRRAREFSLEAATAGYLGALDFGGLPATAAV